MNALPYIIAGFCASIVLFVILYLIAYYLGGD